MARLLRRVVDGAIYHVLNRGNGRRALFSKDADYAAFVKLLGQAVQQFEVELLAYCLMGNHWHLLLRPRKAAALPRFMAWLTVTHARRHHSHYRAPGSGHLYQGRYKSFAVQSDEHFLTVARYIHANPLRAALVERAEKWPWSDVLKPAAGLRVSPWPVARPRGWVRMVNREQDELESRHVARSVERGVPFGDEAWVKRMAEKQGIAAVLRPRGRPPRALETLSERQRRRREKREG